MPPKRKRFNEGDSPQKRQQILNGDAPCSSPLLLPELIGTIFQQLRWKDLLIAPFVCSSWYNVWKTSKDIKYKIKYMQTFGGYSARTYKDITEKNDADSISESTRSFLGLTWKEKYSLCTAQVSEMQENEEGEDDGNQILTVWALDNGHHAFLKKLIADNKYSNLEYYEGPPIMYNIPKRHDYKTLKVIMVDLPKDLRDEIDLFTTLFHATSTNNIRMAKKIFKYGFICDKEVSRGAAVNTLLAKNYEMMTVLSNNKALFYDEELVGMCEELGWQDISWQR